MPSEQLFEIARHIFDAPEFRGITCIEVEAKSAINKVPAASQIPSDYTLSPHRECSHSCVYCMRPETPVLMGDGRTRAIADVRVGDEVYGTIRCGDYRRYVTATVLAHWTTRKAAYRITLEDGTELVASGDHRFLTDRGWKHVTGSEQGRSRRPHLTVNNKLMGTGHFAAAPTHDADYRRGYLCGMVRGGHPAVDATAKAAVLEVMIVVITTGWLLAGASLAAVLRDPRRARAVNALLAATLVAATVLEAT